MTNEITTLLCLFHNKNHARDAMQDLFSSGISSTGLSVLDNSQPDWEQLGGITLSQIGVPDRDHRHLLDGVRSGGLILIVEATADHVDLVDRTFSHHQLAKVDEVAVESPMVGSVMGAGFSSSAVDGALVIPMIEEELELSKREVSRGGVRVHQRVIDVPAEETVALREEHVALEHRAIDRAATVNDLAFQEHIIELTETAEEVVIAKNAQVVEEVRISKKGFDRTEHIHHTVRRTEVEVEELAPQNNSRRMDEL